MYPLSNIAAITGGQLQGNSEAGPVKYLSVDSRKIPFPAQTLFFALVSNSRDGHAFIAEVYSQGVRCFCISGAVDIADYPAAGFVKVTDTLKALQQLAAHHRQQFQIPIIGITGSNGKTIVKEWLNQLLQPDYTIVRSPKSYNSQIGVPLSVWQINESHTLGIFEAGISKPGEMAALRKIIQPTMGVLTNIGAAHDEGFVSREKKTAEKLSLFDSNTGVVFQEIGQNETGGVKRSRFVKYENGKPGELRMVVKGIEKEKGITLIEWDGGLFTFTIPFTDHASIENCMHCIVVCKHLGMANEVLAGRLMQLHPIEMRLEWKKAINNCHLLNDSYSNDLSSLIIALDYLQQQQQGGRQTVILSDIVESGLTDDELYGRVASLLQHHGISRLVAIGPHIGQFKTLLERKTGLSVAVFASTEVFITAFESLHFTNENILLKGARHFGFERIAQLLERQVHRTVLEINLTAIAHNLQQYRSLLQPSTKIMVMVKAFGYGSGDAEIGKLLQFNKVDYLGVAYTDEGLALRKAGIHLPVMVMNPEPAGFGTLEAQNLEPELYSFKILEEFAQYCQAQAISQYPVHIKLDTGMHRLGFMMDEVPALAAWLAGQNTLVVKSVFTHLVASEDPSEDEYTQHQANEFVVACQQLENALGYTFIKHAANTAGIARHPNKHFDMVRLGIGLYGGIGSKTLGLQPATTLKTMVAQIKHIKAGETVGYNRIGKVLTDSVIATVRIGYADGYRRQLGNGKGFMWLHGQPVPIIGNVCMDMTMVDVTQLPEVRVGDEVEVFGKNISLKMIAEWCGTIPYEIMTGISQRVRRVYVQE